MNCNFVCWLLQRCLESQESSSESLVQGEETGSSAVGCDLSKPTLLVSGRGCPNTGLAVQCAHIKGIFSSSKKRECKNFTNANYN